MKAPRRRAASVPSTRTALAAAHLTGSFLDRLLGAGMIGFDRPLDGGHRRFVQSGEDGHMSIKTPLAIALITVTTTFGAAPASADANWFKKAWKAVSSPVKATISVGETAANAVDATVREVVGDKKGAKRSWKRAERHLHDVGSELKDTVEGTGEVILETAQPVTTTIDGAAQGLGHAVVGTIELAGDTLESAYDVGKSTVEGTISVVETTANGLDALARTVVGDEKGAAQSWKRAENHLRDVGDEVTSALEETVTTPFDVLKGTVSVVRDDFAHTFVSGKHPDDVRAAIRDMVAECKARIAAGRPLPPEADISGEVRPFPAPILQLAVAIPASILSLMPGSPQLHEEYEAAVATCERMYEDARTAYMAALDEDAREREEKLRVLASMAAAVPTQVATELQGISADILLALANNLDRRVTDTELWDVAAEHPEIVASHLIAAQDVVDWATNALDCYSAIQQDEELLDRFGKETAVALCHRL